MSKTITSHSLDSNPWNELQISAVDYPTYDRAHNVYRIGGFTGVNLTAQALGIAISDPMYIAFQDGPIPQFGRNGVTIEALIAICVERLRDFQAGPFQCWENQNALTSLLGALETLKGRTRMRQARGVEGTMQP